MPLRPRAASGVGVGRRERHCGADCISGLFDRPPVAQFFLSPSLSASRRSFLRRAVRLEPAERAPVRLWAFISLHSRRRRRRRSEDSSRRAKQAAARPGVVVGRRLTMASAQPETAPLDLAPPLPASRPHSRRFQLCSAVVNRAAGFRSAAAMRCDAMQCDATRLPGRRIGGAELKELNSAVRSVAAQNGA